MVDSSALDLVRSDRKVQREMLLKNISALGDRITALEQKIKPDAALQDILKEVKSIPRIVPSPS